MRRLKSFIVKRLPIAWIFDLTYRKGWWGKKGELYSGEGTDATAVQGYIERVVDLIRTQGVRSIVEVGCGDFSIMQRVLAQVEVSYTGYDVSAHVVAHHSRQHANARTRFVQADAAAANLPAADLLIVRQVLQHIDNARIAAIVAQFDRYRLCLVTEHQALGSRDNANRDKRAGPDTRLGFGSSVHLDLPPFNQRGFERWYAFPQDETYDGRRVAAEIVSYLKAGAPAGGATDARAGVSSA